MIVTQSKGFQQVLTRLGQIDQNARLIGATRLVTFSPDPWAFGLETGRRRSGRLARRAGGAWMFRRGAEQIARYAPKVLAEAIIQPPPATQEAIADVRGFMTRAVQSGTPVRTGGTRGRVTTRSGA